MKTNLLLTSFFALNALVPLCLADGPYHFLTEIPIKGDGGWDYLSVDSAGKRLFVSHGTEVVVVGLEDNQVAGKINDTPGVHGIAIASDLGRAITSNGRENKASIVDLATLHTISKVDTAERPDGLAYNPARGEAYLFCGRARAATVINVRDGTVVTNIPLDGKPEFPAVDADAGRVYDNLEDKSELAVIDSTSHQVITNWPVAPGDEPSGLAIDVKNHRLFAGCGNQMMVMIDGASGRVVSSVPIGKGVDANAFDPGTGFAFASCGDGTTTIAHEDSPDHLTVVQTLPTARGARTMALDPATHKIYLATAKFDSTNPSGGRPRPLPGTFKILVYGLDK